jgi:F-type H+-transporting ATPase subunit delta
MSDSEQARPTTVLDDDARQVARVYAEALLRLAEQQGQADAVGDDLAALRTDVMQRHPELEEFLSSMSVGRARKEEVLRGAFHGRASELLLNFLLVLNAHDRLELLRATAEAYQELLDQRRHRIPVLVRSAVPLSEQQLNRLRDEIRATADGRPIEPILQTRVDPDLLGGLVVQVGDFLYDASVKTRLEQIKNQVLERSSHVVTHQSG